MGKHSADEARSDDASVPVKTRQVRGPRPGYERSTDEPTRERVREMLSPRVVGIFVACFLLQAAFIASYVGAFHDPKPQGISVAVAGPTSQFATQTAQRLNALPDGPLEATTATSAQDAREQVRTGEVQTAYIVNPQTTQDTLLVATAHGASLASAAQTVLERVDASQQRTLRVEDVVPALPKDGRGLTAFYLVVGWLVGGYLMASLLGIRAGNRSRNFRRALWRLGGAVVYAAASGIAGAAIVDLWFESLTGHFWQIAGLGTLVVLAAGFFTYGAAALFGVVGIGLAILIFVVIGNPSAGGAYSYELLPEPWASVGAWLPNGAGVDAVRSIVYFGGESVGRDLMVLLAWMVLGLVIYFGVAARVYWGMKRDVWGPGDEPAGRHRSGAGAAEESDDADADDRREIGDGDDEVVDEESGTGSGADSDARVRERG